MSSKKQKKILFWAYFWKSFELISLIAVSLSLGGGIIAVSISATCLIVSGVYHILGVKFRWQSAHCIAQTYGRYIRGLYREMRPSSYAWTEDEKKNMVAIGIMDIVWAVIVAAICVFVIPA